MKMLGSFISDNANECHMTKIVKLQVIPPPEVGTRTVFRTQDKDALVKGIELESLVCGNCEFVLVENVLAYNQDDVVLECHSCNSYNEISNI
jgi:hypothetical protein